jgi:hypothetical protein
MYSLQLLLFLQKIIKVLVELSGLFISDCIRLINFDIENLKIENFYSNSSMT